MASIAFPGLNRPSRERHCQALAAGEAHRQVPLKLLHLPAEVLQEHLLPYVRAQGHGVQAAFGSTCRTAHHHVMEAVAKPMLGHLRQQLHLNSPSDVPCGALSPQGIHPTALAHMAVTRLTQLFELHGYRRAPVDSPQSGSMDLAAACDVVQDALGGVLVAKKQVPHTFPKSLHFALSCLKGSMHAPLQAWAEHEEGLSSANFLGFRRTQYMVLEQAGRTTAHLDIGLFSRPRTLPPVWLYFSGLKILECRKANLTRLPEAMGHLEQLESLDVSYNRLSTLPASLRWLPLKCLLLRQNHFVAIPDVVERLTNLQTLDLFGNPLVHPTFPLRLNRLVVLDLGACGLSEVPASVFSLSSLKSLGLCANQISALPDDLRHLSRLTFLDVSINRIQSLPAALVSLTQLQALYLHNNPLLALPEFVGSMPRLQELYVSPGDDEDGPPTHNLVLPHCLGNLVARGSGCYTHRAHQSLDSSIED